MVFFLEITNIWQKSRDFWFTTTSLRRALKNLETLYVDPDTSSSDVEIGFLRV
jgi:hypothetical protein